MLLRRPAASAKNFIERLDKKLLKLGSDWKIDEWVSIHKSVTVLITYGFTK